MSNPLSDELTPAVVSGVAQVLNADTLEMYVEQLPADMVAPYLAKLIDAATNISALRKCLETRLILDGQTGNRWTIGSQEYGFFGAKQTGFKDIRGMLSNLHSYGLSLESIADAISEIRVTNLRKDAAIISNEENRKAALAIIEEHRFTKDERGTPRFQPLDEKYAKGAGS